MTDEPDVALVLRVLPDPHARHGRPARDGMYRLKLLLKIAGRQLGLKCIEITDAALTRTPRPTDKTLATVPDAMSRIGA